LPTRGRGLRVALFADVHIESNDVLLIQATLLHDTGMDECILAVFSRDRIALDEAVSVRQNSVDKALIWGEVDLLSLLQKSHQLENSSCLWALFSHMIGKSHHVTNCKGLRGCYCSTHIHILRKPCLWTCDQAEVLYWARIGIELGNLNGADQELAGIWLNDALILLHLHSFDGSISIAHALAT